MAVSFSAAAKAEVCRIFPNRDCCALAQCFGILLYCNTFSSTEVRSSLAAGQRVDHMLHPNVIQYIHQHHLYQ